jgi:hypothetical protein
MAHEGFTRVIEALDNLGLPTETQVTTFNTSAL